MVALPSEIVPLLTAGKQRRTWERQTPALPVINKGPNHDRKECTLCRESTGRNSYCFNENGQFALLPELPRL